ncbi:UrcA family protein [Oceanicaulis sp.]|uniref:UrcA family protein n=1 Tax=Oceanicaulis sp. TaxID=1924941 RepID=UPI000D46E26D
MSTLSVLLVSLAGLALTPASELPAEDTVTQSRAVNFANEQLLSDEGVEAIRQQIAYSARRVCTEPGNLNSYISREARACARTAYEQGLEQLEIKVAEVRASHRYYAQSATESEQEVQ